MSNLFSRRDEAAETRAARLKERALPIPVQVPGVEATALSETGIRNVPEMQPEPLQISILTSDFNLTGAKIDSARDIEVHGTIDGEIKCRNLVVQPGARLTGVIEFETAEIHGHVDGVIQGGRVLLYKTATIVGKLTCASVAIQSGCSLRAQVDCDNSMQLADAAPSAQQGGGRFQSVSRVMDQDFTRTDGKVVRLGGS